MSARKPKPQPEPEPEPGQGLGLGPEPELGLKCPVVSQGLGAAVRQICGASPEIGIKALVSAVKQQFPDLGGVTAKSVRHARQAMQQDAAQETQEAVVTDKNEAAGGEDTVRAEQVGGAATGSRDSDHGNGEGNGNGKAGKPAKVCALCGSPATTVCSGCRAVAYCGRECQVSDWKAQHKRSCSTKNKSKKPTFRQTMFDIGRAAQFFKTNGYTSPKQMETLTELVASHLAWELFPVLERTGNEWLLEEDVLAVLQTGEKTFEQEGNEELRSRFRTSALLLTYAIRDGLDTTRVNVAKLQKTMGPMT